MLLTRCFSHGRPFYDATIPQSCARRDALGKFNASPLECFAKPARSSAIERSCARLKIPDVDRPKVRVFGEIGRRPSQKFTGGPELPRGDFGHRRFPLILTNGRKPPLIFSPFASIGATFLPYVCTLLLPSERQSDPMLRERETLLFRNFAPTQRPQYLFLREGGQHQKKLRSSIYRARSMRAVRRTIVAFGPSRRSWLFLALSLLKTPPRRRQLVDNAPLTSKMHRVAA
jgi:hypothetical protein